MSLWDEMRYLLRLPRRSSSGPSPYVSWDAFWMLLFYTVALAAASITGYGTHEFYALVMEQWLAAAATVVVTGGILLLGIAGTLSENGKTRYFVGMGLLLLIEATAQYFYSQATFTVKVVTQFQEVAATMPSGGPVLAKPDLQALAESPWGRVIPIAYIAVLSAVVVYFDLAATERIKAIKGRIKLYHFTRMRREARARRDARLLELSTNDGLDELTRVRAALSLAERSAAEARKDADEWRQKAQASLSLLTDRERELAHEVGVGNNQREAFKRMGEELRDSQSRLLQLTRDNALLQAENERLQRDIEALEARQNVAAPAVRMPDASIGSSRMPPVEMPAMAAPALAPVSLAPPAPPAAGAAPEATRATLGKLAVGQPITQAESDELDRAIWEAKERDGLTWPQLQQRFGLSEKTLRKRYERYASKAA